MQVAASAHPVLRLIPPATAPPLAIAYNASTVLATLRSRGSGLSEQLNRSVTGASHVTGASQKAVYPPNYDVTGEAGSI